MSKQSFVEQARKIVAEIKAEEARQQKAASALESKRKDLLERGAKHYASIIDAQRSQALQYLTEAHDALAKVGPAPTKPRVDADVESYLSALDAHDKAASSHRRSVAEISTRVFRQLESVFTAASRTRREARELGLDAPPGLAFVAEHQRKHAHYREALDGMCSDISAARVWASLEVDDVAKLVEGLSLPAPDPQAPNAAYVNGVPREPAHDGRWVANGWARLTAEEKAPQPLPRTQTQIDVDVYTERQARVWPGGVVPTRGDFDVKEFVG